MRPARPVCVRCKAVMRIKKNGRVVKYDGHYAHGDEYECGECGLSIIGNFGHFYSDPSDRDVKEAVEVQHG